MKAYRSSDDRPPKTQGPHTLWDRVNAWFEINFNETNVKKKNLFHAQLAGAVVFFTVFPPSEWFFEVDDFFIYLYQYYRYGILAALSIVVMVFSGAGACVGICCLLGQENSDWDHNRRDQYHREQKFFRRYLIPTSVVFCISLVSLRALIPLLEEESVYRQEYDLRQRVLEENL